MTVRDLLAAARWRLEASAGGATPREASLLLAHVLGVSEARLLARDREPVAERERRRFESLLSRRLHGEPVAYLTGEREFYGRSFAVDRRVLIPRPETELLIEEALALRPDAGAPLLDIGTGSGCLAVTLACELPTVCVVATDLSPGALAVARHNALRHGVGSRVQPIRTDLTAGIRLESVGLAVSNPPYVAVADAADLPVDVREFEPSAALFAGLDGMDALTRLLDTLRDLSPGTPVLLEIGAGQADALRDLAATRPFRLDRIRPDYADIPRVAVLRRANG
ncbi:MAG: peptide chain release factor N(5)-glutamine methyltransferase [Thermoanaerobaculia bacterium]